MNPRAGSDPLKAASEATTRTGLSHDAATNLLNEVVALVSHDLRSPISSILTWVELFRDGLSDEQRARGLDAMERGARAQQRLVQSIVAFARLRSGALALNPEESELRVLVDRAVQDVQPWAKVKGISLSVDGEVRAPIRVDPDHLVLALSHLIDNAVKHSFEGQGVAIELEEAGDRVRVVIRDRGDGFERGAAEHTLIQAREIAPPGGRRRRGLGLPLALGLVEIHAGTIELQSEGPRKGTTVRVELPTRKESSTQDAPPA
jgi:signal transduction histidine kinase